MGISQRSLRYSWIVLVLLIAAAGSCSPAADAAPRRLTLEGEPTTADAWRGIVIWSRWDSASRTYRLMQWRDGVTSPVPIAPNARILEATLGPGRGGHPTVVYARCTDQGAPYPAEDYGTSAREPAGCDIHAVDLDSGTERAVAGASDPQRSERRPSVYGARVAFATFEPGCGTGALRQVRLFITTPRGGLAALRKDPTAAGCGAID